MIKKRLSKNEVEFSFQFTNVTSQQVKNSAIFLELHLFSFHALTFGFKTFFKMKVNFATKI